VAIETHALPAPALHLIEPVGQPELAGLHLPKVQICPPAHARPHVPQLSKSALKFTHTLEHFVMPVRQTHTPDPSQ